MKFRTEIKIRPFAEKIGYRDTLLLLGSCFADEMKSKLKSLKFKASGNFCGPLFNPASIAAQLSRSQEPRPVGMEELHRDAGDCWFHYDTNTLLSDPDPEAVLARCNASLEALRHTLSEAKYVIVTFGTAWVYRLRETGHIVANCHKQPQALFERQRLSAAEIVAEWSSLLSGLLSDKQVIFTVSPVRHLGDGLDGNCVSKATLRVAAAELKERFPQAHYFPAYEILTDDLRDYRYYADDLVHPSQQAVEYIWELFSEALLSERARKALPAVERIVNLMGHRPRQPHSPEYRALCRQALDTIAELEKDEGIDFSCESEYFTAMSCPKNS